MVSPLYISIQTIVTAASLLAAVIAIFSAIFAVYRWYLKQNKQDLEIKKMQSELCLLTYGIEACLDGLEQLGANHNVTDAKKRISKHLNKQAHDQEE